MKYQRVLRNMFKKFIRYVVKNITTRFNTRKGGQLKGWLRISDDFDAPLPKELIDKFHNNDI
jgi:hypothetical protein